MRGNHHVYRKPGSPMNLSVPDQNPISEGTLRAIVRKMGLSVDDFLALARK